MRSLKLTELFNKGVYKMKSAMEIKEQIDIKRKEYIDSLNFDNLYSAISNRIEKVSLFNSYVAITYKENVRIFEFGNRIR